MITPPFKWVKYELLALWGLASHDMICKDVLRFKLGKSFDSEYLLNQISTEYNKAISEGVSYLFVIKLIPQYGCSNLPNYRFDKIYNRSEVLKFISAANTSEYIEVWYCKTRIDLNITSVAGRILFCNSCTTQFQIFEQVSHASPRVIENYNTLFCHPFIQASRNGWGRRININKIHIPPYDYYSAAKISDELCKTVNIIEEMRDRIIAFCDFLEENGCSSYSLEYKYIDNCFKFIDWDSTIDEKIVSKFANKLNAINGEI